MINNKRLFVSIMMALGHCLALKSTIFLHLRLDLRAEDFARQMVYNTPSIAVGESAPDHDIVMGIRRKVNKYFPPAQVSRMVFLRYDGLLLDFPVRVAEKLLDPLCAGVLVGGNVVEVVVLVVENDWRSAFRVGDVVFRRNRTEQRIERTFHCRSFGRDMERAAAFERQQRAVAAILGRLRVQLEGVAALGRDQGVLSKAPQLVFAQLGRVALAIALLAVVVAERRRKEVVVLFHVGRLLRRHLSQLMARSIGGLWKFSWRMLRATVVFCGYHACQAGVGVCLLLLDGRDVAKRFPVQVEQGARPQGHDSVINGVGVDGAQFEAAQERLDRLVGQGFEQGPERVSFGLAQVAHVVGELFQQGQVAAGLAQGAQVEEPQDPEAHFGKHAEHRAGQAHKVAEADVAPREVVGAVDQKKVFERIQLHGPAQRVAHKRDALNPATLFKLGDPLRHKVRHAHAQAVDALFRVARVAAEAVHHQVLCCGGHEPVPQVEHVGGEVGEDAVGDNDQVHRLVGLCRRRRPEVVCLLEHHVEPAAVQFPPLVAVVLVVRRRKVALGQRREHRPRDALHVLELAAHHHEKRERQVRVDDDLRHHLALPLVGARAVGVVGKQAVVVQHEPHVEGLARLDGVAETHLSVVGRVLRRVPPQVVELARHHMAVEHDGAVEQVDGAEAGVFQVLDADVHLMRRVAGGVPDGVPAHVAELECLPGLVP